ncbi:MAG: tyrosine-type recombinase/integrase [Candidatus Sedimenticola sp. 6PFRAG7]
MAKKSIPESPPRGFTAKFIEHLPTPQKRYELADKKTVGLRLRISPGGAKTFIWYHRNNGKLRLHTLGQFGDDPGKLSLSAAREELQKLKRQHEAGTLNAPSQGDPKTVSELAEIFYKRRILPKRKRPEVVRDVLDRDVIPKLGRLKLRNVTAARLSSFIDGIVDRGAASHAGKVLAIIKQMFGFAEGRGYVDRSPAFSLKKEDLGVQDNRRERSLSLEEINLLWKALETAPRMSPQFKLGLRILLLTGVRSGELRQAKWTDIDLRKRSWHIPAGNTKNSKALYVPLSPLAASLFKELKDVTGEFGWVMASPESLANPKEEDKHVDDKALARAVNRLLKMKVEVGGKKQPFLDIPKFVPHDLRRTLRTHLSKLKVAPHIAEKCLNHSLGRLEETYDTHDYYDERKAALRKWAHTVDLVVNDQDNVVVMRA